MRIGIDITPLQTGHRYRGIGTYVYHLVKEFIVNEHSDHFYLVAYRDIPIELLVDLPNNFKVILLPRPICGRFSALVSHQYLLPKSLVKNNLDIFHFTSFTPSPWVGGLPWRCGVPFIVTICDLIPMVLPEMRPRLAHWRLFYAWQLRVTRNAEHVITISQSSRQDIISYLNLQSKKVSAIYLGVEPPSVSDLASPRIEALLERQYILHVGGGFPNKNVSQLLSAFGIWRARGEKPYSLVLVGPGSENNRNDLKKVFPEIAEDVFCFANLNKSALKNLYRNASLFVFPSKYEGFGLPPLEAMAYGVPVIAANSSALPEVLGEAAIYFNPYDIKDLVNAMELVLNDEKIAAELRRRGLSRARQFNWEQTAKETLMVYHSFFN